MLWRTSVDLVCRSGRDVVVPCALLQEREMLCKTICKINEENYLSFMMSIIKAM